MPKKNRTYYYLALLLGLIFHANTSFFTFEKTYDAFVHIFFAQHYAESWFSTWSYKWYTGFATISYPPLVHQSIAIFSKFIGLKLGFLLWSTIMVLVYIRGVYKFSEILVGEKYAGYAALMAPFAPSFVEALHIFGQLPSLTGVAFLLNALPQVYKWFRFLRYRYLFTGFSLLACTTCAHHVTTIFGMVFFILPIMGLAVIDRACDLNGVKIDRLKLPMFLKEVFVGIPRAIVFGMTVIAITLTFVFPYWYWSATDPINQISIPHGSRDSFIEVMSSGLVFFAIPWCILLLALPFIFQKMFSKRLIFFGLSFSLAFVLGTGGTTPIPILLLGENAFNILTLDRFTFWASIMALPFWGVFIFELSEGSLKKYIIDRTNKLSHTFVFSFVFAIIIICNILIANIGFFKSTQPDKIDIDPIVKFLEMDQHDNWRYLTLGFGDQMAWLSANTKALSVDGNYHSARRLPEMTVRAVERLENAKYSGMSGLTALQQFISNADKFNLKYIFSNDKFYEPILYFSGWSKVRKLDNNIDIWEKKDVAPLPKLLPYKSIPKYQSIMWGILPIASLVILFLVCIFRKVYNLKEDRLVDDIDNSSQNWHFHITWMFVLFFGIMFFLIKSAQVYGEQNSKDNVVNAYFNALDFKEFSKAYTFFHHNNKPELEEYLIQLSLEDGMLASYTKLKNLEISYTETIESKTFAHIKANWDSSVKSYTSYHSFELVKEAEKWFINYPYEKSIIPPNQYFNTPSIDWKNQGRRSVVIDQTDRRDELDRPEVFISEANLIRKDTAIYLVGMIVNTDNVPAYITINGVLLDENNDKILDYNCRDIAKFRLMPKESTPFRIDFQDAYKQTFIFNESNAIKLEDPSGFLLNVKSMVTDEQMYTHYGINNIKLSDDSISGELINSGTKEISIPQILTTYYNHDQKLIWVEPKYLDSGVRPQRSKSFEFANEDLSDKKIIAEGLSENLFINGISRDFMNSYIEVDRLKSRENLKVRIFVNPFVPTK